MAVSPTLPVGQADPTLPRKLPEYLRSAKLPEGLRLPPLSADEARVKKRGPLTSMGVRRFVSDAALSSRAEIASSIDGHAVLSVSITSPGAKRIRVHFRDFDAGDGEVWVYAPGDEIALAPFTGKGIFHDGEFWSGGVDSETVVIAYVTARGSSKLDLPFVIDAVAHQWSRVPASNEAPAAQGLNQDAAASCNLDVSCYPAYVGLATAVARFDFVADDGTIGFCSGSLVNTQSGSKIPYFLTAHHCISSVTEARNMVVQFLDQTMTCNGLPPNTALLPVVMGGTYLAGAAIAQGDYSFVQLTSAPAGVAFLGWNTALDQSASIVGIHHPQASYTRISFGTRAADQNTMVGSETAPASLYFRINWSSGLTEEGSSGSPLINSSGQILGTLTSGVITPPGTSACAIPQWSVYGRFSDAYSVISSYLNDTQAASLTVSPSNVTFQVNNGVVTPVSQAISVTTQSTSAITFTLQTNQPWLHVSGANTASASSPGNLVLTIDPSGLKTPGTFSGAVTVSSSSAPSVSIGVSVTVTNSSVVTVTVTPNPVYQQSPDADGYSWFYMIRCAEQAGVSTQLTGLKIGGVDYSSQIVNFFGSISLPGFGTATSNVRSRGLNVPVSQTIEVDGVDVGSNRLWQATTQVSFLGPSAPSSFSLSRTSLSFYYMLAQTDPPVQQVAISSSGGSSIQWSATADAGWLTLSPASSATPSTLSVGIRTAGLAAGTYSGTVIITASGVASQRISVALTVTPKTGPTMSVGSLVNGASFAQSAAPGMLMTIFGTNLAPETASASSVPLPTSLTGVSVTMNGVKAPLYFVSPTQLNVQVPFEVVPEWVNVTVNLNGQTDSQPLQLADVAPGIFTDIQMHLVPFSSGHPGDVLIMYFTGQGAVSPSVATGYGPALGTSVDQLPQPVQKVGLTVAGVSAPILFAGIPPGLVGVTQINFRVPQVVPGEQPVVVTVGGQPSRTALLTVLPGSSQ